MCQMKSHLNAFRELSVICEQEERSSHLNFEEQLLKLTQVLLKEESFENNYELVKANGKYLAIIPRNRVVHELIADEVRSDELA